MRRLLFLLALSLLSACSAKGPLFERMPAPHKEQALLYFYRPDTDALSARTLNVSLDSTHWAKLDNNAFVVKYVSPGEHSITTQWSKWALDKESETLLSPLCETIELKAGEVYYIKFASSVTNFAGRQWFHWGFKIVPENEALQEISTTRAQQ
jgi:hypothetical protein